MRRLSLQFPVNAFRATATSSTHIYSSILTWVRSAWINAKSPGDFHVIAFIFCLSQIKLDFEMRQATGNPSIQSSHQESLSRTCANRQAPGPACCDFTFFLTTSWEAGLRAGKVCYNPVISNLASTTFSPTRKHQTWHKSQPAASTFRYQNSRH